MMTHASLAVLIAACVAAPPRVVAVDPVIQPHASPVAHPPPAQFDRPAMARYHMQLHFGDLRTLEHVLLGGDLERGTTLAHLLARTTDAPISRAWDADIRAVSQAARALTRATTIDEALRREARIGGACASCHLHALSLPVFGTLSPAPRDLPTAEARMARHAWATDRLWEGLVGADDVRWGQGLEVLSLTTAPVSALAGTDAYQARLQQLARAQLVASPIASPIASVDARAEAYGELLVACAGCHARRR